MSTLLNSEQQNPDWRGGYAGGCLIKGQPICVYQEEPNCDEGTFITAHYMRDRNKPETPVDHCDTELGSVTIGRCDGPDGACANLAEQCDDQDSFMFDETCTISVDLKDYSPVLYPQCGKRCVWSKAECPEGEAYVKSSPDCQSENVEIGSCWARQFYCSISQSSCVQKGEPSEPFMSHNETIEIGGIHCYLSKVPKPPSTGSPTSSPKPSNEPTQDLTSEPEPPSEAPSLYSASSPSSSIEAQSSDDNNLPIGAIAGIVVGVALLVGALVGFASYRMGMHSGRKKKKQKQKAPMRNVPTGHGEAGDDVSELGSKDPLDFKKISDGQSNDKSDSSL